MARDAVAYLEAERDRLLRDNDRLLSLTVDQHATIERLTDTVAELMRRLPELPTGSPEPQPASEPPTPLHDVEHLPPEPVRLPIRRPWWRRWGRR